MHKINLGLLLFSLASSAFAQGNYSFPMNPTPAYPTLVPNSAYYPFSPSYTMYPYAMQNPYYVQPLPAPYAVYPNNAPVRTPYLNSIPTATPSYTYTSPYNSSQPAMPGPKPAPAPQVKKETKSWGDTRYIWPDFYTDQTSDMWDKMINAPHDLGYMPGGWRFPSFSSPDPVTVGDAVANQMPPVAEEVPNFMNFTN